MKKIGILGGGQLGRMTIEASRGLLSYIEVLSEEYPAPGAELADETVLGDLMDREAVLELAGRVDVLSYEIEHVNVDALFEAERSGIPVMPGAGLLAIIQDKAAQKSLMDRAGIPTAPWAFVGDGQTPPTAEALIEAAANLDGFPVVQKARRGGYDGRGVASMRNEDDARLPSKGGRLLSAPGFIESKVDFTKELAVVVARDTLGNVDAYPCVEMVFDERANLCDSVLMPAAETGAVQAEARRVALAAIDALHVATLAEAAERGVPTTGAVGLFGVELFLTRDGRILVNEIAPRPHNSGHLTIEACVTSQFMQYYRILAGYPLGSTELLRPAMMVNLLGEAGSSGEPEYQGLPEALAVPGVSVHLYGKRSVRPFRKMGHLTAIGATAEEAIARAEEARRCIKISGPSPQ
ncbi:MAG: 5-(carboxyamino)imidazole ribonucleotide synthase [Spirochaetales bacterium]|nr:MAG: 5-(carboxyamino)imidazole ribonucleotide synthase [Spirochaetales bacterium]